MKLCDGAASLDSDCDCLPAFLGLAARATRGSSRGVSDLNHELERMHRSCASDLPSNNESRSDHQAVLGFSTSLVNSSVSAAICCARNGFDSVPQGWVRICVGPQRACSEQTELAAVQLIRFYISPNGGEKGLVRGTGGHPIEDSFRFQAQRHLPLHTSVFTLSRAARHSAHQSRFWCHQPHCAPITSCPIKYRMCAAHAIDSLAGGDSVMKSNL